jgi:hypothetical protein
VGNHSAYLVVHTGLTPLTPASSAPARKLMNKLHRRRYHVPPEALGIGYEEWAAQFLAEHRPNEPHPQRPQRPAIAQAEDPRQPRPAPAQSDDPSSRILMILGTFLTIIIIFILSFFVFPHGVEPPLPGDIMTGR